jgi:hypothetical protein
MPLRPEARFAARRAGLAPILVENKTGQWFAAVGWLFVSAAGDRRVESGH